MSIISRTSFARVLAILFSVGASSSSWAAGESEAMATKPYTIAAIADLPADAQTVLQASIRGFLRNSASLASRDAGDLGWDCLAAGSLADAGVPNAAQKLQAIADHLVLTAIPSKSGFAGWGYQGKSANSCPDGGLDAFGDGTCNSRSTAYSFQTGLGIACLAKAGAIFKHNDYLAMAQDILNYWNSFSIPRTPCPDCIYYWYSDNQNDRGRFVRNVNVFMGFGAAMLGSASGQRGDGAIADKVMRADLSESKSGNRGYLGVADPQWIAKKAEAAQNIENHAAAMAVLIDQVGAVVGSAAYRSHGKSVWEEWATCDNKRCQVAACNVYGGDATRCQATLTAAHCAFRRVDSRADSQCREYLSRAKSVSTFGIWSAMVGGTR